MYELLMYASMKVILIMLWHLLQKKFFYKMIQNIPRTILFTHPINLFFQVEENWHIVRFWFIIHVYAYHKCIFQKARTFQYITLLKGDNSVFSLTCNTYHFFLYKMVTFITLPYLLLMLSSNFNINGCCFFIFYM